MPDASGRQGHWIQKSSFLYAEPSEEKMPYLEKYCPSSNLRYLKIGWIIILSEWFSRIKILEESSHILKLGFLMLALSLLISLKFSPILRFLRTIIIFIIKILYLYRMYRMYYSARYIYICIFHLKTHLQVNWGEGEVLICNFNFNCNFNL